MKRLLGIAAVLALCSTAASADEHTVVGKWTVGSKIDPMTDSRRCVSALSSSDGMGLAFSRRGDGLLLAMIIFPVELNGWIGERTSEITYRFDESDPVSGDWNVTVKGKTAVLEEGVEDLIRTSRASSRLVVRALYSRGDRVTHVFDLARSAEALDLFDQCRNGS